MVGLLEKEVELLGCPSKVFVGGFGNGAAIALSSFLKFNVGQLGGVAGLNGAF